MGLRTALRLRAHPGARSLGVLVGSGALVFGALGVAPVGAVSAATATISGTHVIVGAPGARVNVSQLPSGGAVGDYMNNKGPELDFRNGMTGRASLANASSPLAPRIVSSAIATPVMGATSTMKASWNGISHADSRSAAGYSVEPPDQGLCANSSYVLELVNVAGSIYSTSGSLVAGPFSLASFFGENPDANVTDPKCFYDTSAQRFYATTLVYTMSGGNFTGSWVDVAVSTSSSPSSLWLVYRVDTSDSENTGCPCLGDQPLFGYDNNGLYMSVNEFTSDGSGFNGAQLWAIRKADVLAGNTANATFYGNLVDGANPAFSLQPAVMASGAYNFEYFLTSRDWTGEGINSVGTWALYPTSGVGTLSPPTLQRWTVGSEWYGQPPLATQRDSNNRPLGQQNYAALGFGSAQPVGYINSNDDRMNQVVYRNGTLWGAVNTFVEPYGDSTNRVGLAWFAIKPPTSLSGTPTLVNQGYVGAAGYDLVFPSLAVDNAGPKLVYSVTGPTIYPSVAYSVFSGWTSNGSFPSIQVAARGANSDDGFTCYITDACRFGDYSAAQVSVDGNSVWVASMYTTTTRTFYANWGTRILRLSSY